MMEARPTASFPVVFYDGECEIDIGNIGIHPSLEFKKLQSILSQKIGIAPHQITLSIVCRKKSRPNGTRKIPINEKVNFVTILQQEKDCYFLVSLKSSRRGRRGGRTHLEEDTTSSHSQFLIDPPQKVLLRRDSNAKPLQFGEFSPPSSIYDQYPNQGLRLGFRDYENQLQIQKENYLMSINSYPYSNSYEFGYGYGTGGGGVGRVGGGGGVCESAGVSCEVCSNAAGGQIPFHWCVRDPTTVGFRSTVGPIARPSKG